MTVTVQVVGLFMARFAASIAFNFYQQNQIELFPTQIRAIAMPYATSGDILAMMILPLA